MMTERRYAGDSEGWVAALHGPSATREKATADLRALLMRGARFELSRTRHGLGEIPSEEADALATEAADAALIAVLASLDSYRAKSRFTTWASKYALREAGMAVHRRTRRQREGSVDLELELDPAAGSSLRTSAALDPWS